MGYRGRQRRGHTTAPQLFCSRRAPLCSSALALPLTAGSCGHSAPGRSGHESPTPGNACSPPSGGHTPAHTENLGIQGTGSKPSCGREESDWCIERPRQGDQDRDRGTSAADASHPSWHSFSVHNVPCAQCCTTGPLIILFPPPETPFQPFFA